MDNNRHKQNSTDSFTADYDIPIHRLKGDKVGSFKLFPLYNNKRGKSLFNIFGIKILRRKHPVFSDSSSYFINSLMDIRMATLNIGLLTFNVYALVQAQNPSDIVNFGVLTGMIATMSAYIYFLHKKYDKRIEDMTKEHREERNEWREAMEKQHVETRNTMKEVTKTQHEDSLATTKALTDLHLLIQRLQPRGN